MKRITLLLLVVLSMMLCSCSKPTPAPEPEEPQINITDETVQLFSNKKIAALKEGETLPYFLVEGEDTPLYYEEELRETVKNYYQLQYQTDIEYLKGEYKGEPVYKAVSVKKYESPLDNIPVLKDYDISWKENAQQYDGDFSYEEYLPEDIYTKRTACRVFEEEYPSGVAGSWSVCKEVGGDLPVYPFEEALNHLEGQIFTIIKNGYYTDETVKYEETLFYSILKDSDTKIPVPDIYMFAAEADEDLCAKIEGGEVSLEVYKTENGSFLFIDLTLENPDYDPSKGNLPAHYYYSSVVFKPK